jgi:hypothetical protein
MLTTTLGFVAAVCLGGAGSASTAPEGLVVHEWGTFTSFSGPSGDLKRFGVRVGDDLPGFVRARMGGSAWAPIQPGMFGKEDLLALQRMETPVIYFYSDKPRDVSVEVRLNSGEVTEVFPPVSASTASSLSAVNSVATAVQPAVSAPPWASFYSDNAVRGESVVRWDNLHIRSRFCCDVTSFLDAGTSHYASARATDADPVTFDLDGKESAERFVFYRGVTESDLGVHARATGKDGFVIDRVEHGPLGAVFAVEIQDGRVRFAQADGVQAGARMLLPVETSSEEGLEEAMTAALARAGLYDREAAAMVATWKHLWFGESGTRLLAILPQETVDGVLPLRVSPEPASVSRVFVARLEMLTPERLEEIKVLLKQRQGSNVLEQGAAEEGLRTLGRFYGPAVKLAGGDEGC